MITGTARDHDDTIEVTVTPGGGLRDLRLTDDALRYGTVAFADAVLAAVHVATVRANRTARQAADDPTDLDALGLTDDPAVSPAEYPTRIRTTSWTSL
jgi:hypothetical protein